MDSVHSTSISLPLRLQAPPSESPLLTGIPVLPVSWDGKSCGLLRHWSRGRTDPPAVEGTPGSCPRGIHSFSPASPSEGEEPSRLPEPPCSSRTTWLPRSIEGALETRALVLKAVILTPAFSEPQKPHWDLLWWVLPPLSQESFSPQDLPAPPHWSGLS